MEIKLLSSLPDSSLYVIPQRAVRAAYRPTDDPRNACWDLFITKSGRVFYAVCAELYVSAKVSIYEYLYETNELKLCFDLSDHVCQSSDSISASKVHTSMCEMPDGRIIMTTHTTAQSQRHPYWLPEEYYNHTFEGYQGSLVLIYDPQTGTVENLGIPVPHESIYGARYDEKKNALYFSGYIRGHLYRLDLNTLKLHDYGQVTEFGSFRLHVGPDSNIYMSSRSGDLIRIRTETGELEELGVMFQRDYEPYSTGVHTVLNYAVNASDKHIYLAYIFSQNLYSFDTESCALVNLGSVAPDGLPCVEPYAPYALALDENGVLWYALVMRNELDMAASYLCRWDISSGERPRSLGLLGTEYRTNVMPSEGHVYDRVYYVADSNHGLDAPGILAIDLDKLEAWLRDENGIFSNDSPLTKDILPYTMLSDISAARARYPYTADEFDRQMSHYRHFADYMKEYSAFRQANPMAVVCREVLSYPLWQRYGAGNACVTAVRYDGDEPIALVGNRSVRYLHHAHTDISETTEMTEITSDNEAMTMLDGVTLPSLPGRQYRARPSCAVRIGEERCFFGTEDGVLGIYDNKHGVYGLGACNSCSGGVTDVCYCESAKNVYGLIGGKHDIGIVFSWNERNGLQFMGSLHHNTPTGLACGFELSSIAVNNDGTRVAIGTRDRLGVLFELVL